MLSYVLFLKTFRFLYSLSTLTILSLCSFAELNIRAFLNKKQNLKEIIISVSEMKNVALRWYTLRPNWDYSICPVKM